jgi:hypothetical protein
MLLKYVQEILRIALHASAGVNKMFRGVSVLVNLINKNNCRLVFVNLTRLLALIGMVQGWWFGRTDKLHQSSVISRSVELSTHVVRLIMANDFFGSYFES